jgi:hypothetical protein
MSFGQSKVIGYRTDLDSKEKWGVSTATTNSATKETTNQTSNAYQDQTGKEQKANYYGQLLSAYKKPNAFGGQNLILTYMNFILLYS